MEGMALKASLTACRYCGTHSNASPYCCRACESLDKILGPLPLVEAKQNPYSHYDTQEFRDLYRQNKGEYDYVFYAEGLHCSSCVHLLEKLPEFYSEIVSARVHFSSSTVAVKLTGQASLGQVAFVLKELGYSPSLLLGQDNIRERHLAENRSYLNRIAVAGFCAGNTMLFVIPVYAGLAGKWAQVFNWLSFALFLPILFYSAMPFYRGAWNSLKYQVVNVDLPIVIAMLSGFILSSFNLFRGQGEIYFDSTASFLFFILSARYLLKRVQQNYLSPSNLKSFFNGEKYEVQVGNETRSMPWSALKSGQVINVKQSQALPSDAELLSTHATVDLSLFNGESFPRVFAKGMKLFAGSKVLDREISIQLTSDFANSKLGQLLSQLDEGVLSKSPFINLTDKLAQKLILTVFTIAVLFFIFYAAIDPVAAFNRSLALIVLACPCALAFGSPLTFALALKKAQQKGLLLKDASTLEKLLEIKNVFFDKTGTLTEGQLKLSYTEPAVMPLELQQIILSLEAPSYHPLAFALRRAWPLPEQFYSVEKFEEVLGRGVRGEICGSTYEIKNLSESTHESEIAIEVLKNQKSICRLYFSDELRSDSAPVVAELKSQGIECFLLSGDRKSRAQHVAAICKINKDHVHAELFPEDKMAFISQYSKTCMIGDGANDSLSLKKADVGIAVKGSVDLSLQSADVYLTRGGLRPVLDLFSLAKKTRKVLVRNLTLSLFYNTAAGGLALAGFINPMMAAILMPISSAAIILSSLWGFR